MRAQGFDLENPIDTSLLKQETEFELNLIPAEESLRKKAHEVAESLSASFWERRVYEDPRAVAEIIFRYAIERIQKEERRAEIASFRASEIAAEKKLRRNVKQKAALMMESTDIKDLLSRSPYAEKVIEDMMPRYLLKERTTGLYEPRSKEKEDLAPSTLKGYARLEKQISQRIDITAATPWEVVEYLISIARQYSKSTFFRHRAVLLKMAETEKEYFIIRAIEAMPWYSDICEMVQAKPEKVIGRRTKERRRKKDSGTFQRLLAQLTPEMKDAIRAIAFLGLRVGELPSLSIFISDSEIIARIENSKTGSRLKSPGSAIREISFSLHSIEGRFFTALARKHGARPFSEWKKTRITSAWARARKKIGLPKGSQEWCLHALRHWKANALKQRFSAEMREKHGRNWYKNPALVEEWRKKVSEWLGHSHSASAQRYG